MRAAIPAIFFMLTRPEKSEEKILASTMLNNMPPSNDKIQSHEPGLSEKNSQPPKNMPNAFTAYLNKEFSIKKSRNFTQNLFKKTKILHGNLIIIFHELPWQATTKGTI
ncbi:MAG: hypothetical protein K6G50_01660 [bacterium]|nr:hypothetical protein [bacterium]